MIILSKLADYGVIVATHLATHPERQENAAAVAMATRLLLLFILLPLLSF